ncbi:hypothetical protein ACFSHT_40700 [Paraburkholderia silviterrae]|uniref:Uncharacterized protein n=1 Tax=Paraburkholderia silviterrae TaxID=2528715 RepID=A0A4R5M1J8_9BURK|nr:hypothetical protein [Paraburkholderia silviterrae]TDG19151.1 hypothetical protein EYW47_32000 [Paraburkholderia silviterrae]
MNVPRPATHGQDTTITGSLYVAFDYEAGRDDFWLHLCLEAHQITDLVANSASIEVNRRRRRAHAFDNLLKISHPHGYMEPVEYRLRRKRQFISNGL